MMDILDRLLEHDTWATMALLERCRRLSDDQLDQTFDIGHQTIRATLAHQIGNLDFWMALMQGQTPVRPAKTASLVDLIATQQRAYPEFAQLARQVRDEGRLEDTFPDHHGFPMSFGGAILMVTLHNEVHRNDVIHMLSRMGVPDLTEVELDHGLWDFTRRNVWG